MARELAGRGVTALSLVPDPVRTEFMLGAFASEAVGLEPDGLHSPRFIGRCVAALAMDPDVMEKTGGRHHVQELALEYRFTDPGEENE